MRPPLEAGSLAWPMRIFRPWVVASIAGVAIGASLLNFDPDELPSSYAESAPRAAVYDTPVFNPAFVPTSSSDSTGPAASTELFAPAAPIAAFADLATETDPAPAP